MNRISAMSPRFWARIAGLLYLVSGMAFSFSENTVRGKLVVYGDAAATAHNILTHEHLYRLAVAGELVPLYMVVTIILYFLLRSVNKSVALLATAFSLMGCVIQTILCLLHLAPVVILGSTQSSTGFTAEQLQNIALFALKLGAQGSSMMMVFFGLYCVGLGYLILRSTFLPRIIGAFLILAGVSYQISSFANFLWPSLADVTFRYIAIPGGALGEGSLMLWLTIIGLNSPRWMAQADAKA